MTGDTGITRDKVQSVLRAPVALTSSEALFIESRRTGADYGRDPPARQGRRLTSK